MPAGSYCQRSIQVFEVRCDKKDLDLCYHRRHQEYPFHVVLGDSEYMTPPFDILSRITKRKMSSIGSILF